MYTPPRRARCQLTHRDSSHTLFVTVRMFARTHMLYCRLSPACPDYAETMEQRGSVVRVTLGIDYVIMWRVPAAVSHGKRKAHKLQSNKRLRGWMTVLGINCAIWVVRSWWCQRLTYPPNYNSTPTFTQSTTPYSTLLLRHDIDTPRYVF